MLRNKSQSICSEYEFTMVKISKKYVKTYEVKDFAINTRSYLQKIRARFEKHNCIDLTYTCNQNLFHASEFNILNITKSKQSICYFICLKTFLVEIRLNYWI